MTDDLDIPPFLRRTIGEPKKDYTGIPLTDPNRGGTVEGWRLREEERRKAFAAEKRAKNAASLERLKVQHEGERYDRKLKQWVPQKEK